MKSDILIFMSDQHGGKYSGSDSAIIDTPTLNMIRANGTSFTEAYTSCPLCVPARMSMLSGMLPSRTGIFSNSDTLPQVTPTFLHSMAAAGYETVLIGRMHFIGIDQRHGFMKRLAGDITPVTWNRYAEKLKEERGVFLNTFGGKQTYEVIGGGDSPVWHYDKMVIDTALDYLSREHEKPQCIVIGTYAPHFPYVAPPELYSKYLERVELPELYGKTPDYFHQLLTDKQIHLPEQVERGILAAYYGLIENLDRQIGEVRHAFMEYTQRKNTPYVFCYLSDHGDQVGERNLYGKNTFFEGSAKIPLLFEGTGIKANQVIDTPVSIMDLGPTICELSAAEQIGKDGISLAPLLKGDAAGMDRTVVSEYMDGKSGQCAYGVMLRDRRYKFISYHGYEEWDMLFDLIDDPGETANVIAEVPEAAERFRQKKSCICNPVAVEELHREHIRNSKHFQAFEYIAGGDQSERWQDNPESARSMPAISAWDQEKNR